jgi:hypothetical protein
MAEYPLIVHECSHRRRVAAVCSAAVFRFEVARPRNAHALSTDIAATQPNDVGRYHEQPGEVL